MLTKAITGDAAAYALTSFDVTVTCSANDAVLPGFPITVQVTAGHLPADPDDPTQSGPVTVTPDIPGAVTISNDYRAGGLQIAKPGCTVRDGVIGGS